MKKPIYLVPLDFSSVSIEALKTAIGIAKHNDGSVFALHVVAKKADRDSAKAQLSTIIDSLSKEEAAVVESRIIVGSIYDDIAKTAEIINASLIVMGTHGAVGMQKLFGSHALKLVNSTGVPFVIMQDGSSLSEIKTIVMPFSFAKETIQIANFVGSIAKKFGATIHLVEYVENDEILLSKSQVNKVVISKFFDEHQVDYKITTIDKSKDFMKNLLDYTVEVNADLIAISFYIYTILPTMNSFVQSLIENNKKVPILTCNTEELTITSGYSFMTI